MRRSGAAHRYTIALILAILVAREVQGGEPPGYLAVRTYGAESGIENPDASLGQLDGEGFFWLSTLDGIYRFDGERFERYGLEAGLPSVQVSAMTLDAQGRLLVATQLGLVRWNGDRFISVPTEGVPPMHGHVLLDAAGRWVLANAQGLFVETAAGSGRYSLAPEWPGGPAEALWLERSGELLVGAGTRLLRRDTLGHWRASEVPPARGSITAIARDGQARLWLRGQGWLASQASPGAPFEDRSSLLRGAQRLGLKLRVGARGQLLVPVRSGLLEIHGEQARFLPLRLSERELYLQDALEDREGSLWLVSLGVHRTVGRGLWTSHDAATGLPSDVIWGLARGPDGTLWVGTEKGLARATAEGWRVVPGLSSYVLRGVVVDSQGTVWASGSPAALHRYEPRTGKLRTFGEESGFTAQQTYALTLEPDGTLWVASTQGLLRAEQAGEDWRFIPEVPPSSRMPFVGVTRDGSGRIWATGDGLHVREAGSFRRLGTAEGLRDDRLRYVLARRDGRICVSYVEPLGLSCFTYRDGRLAEDVHLTRGAGLHNATVYQMGEDASGRLWVGTGAGVDIFGEGWQDHFGLQQGLPGNDTDGNSFLADADGTVWVGTSTGLGRFEGSSYSGPLAPPEVKLLGVTLGPHVLHEVPRERLQVEHDAATLEVRFASLRFHDVAHLEYSVRLVGLDQWHPPTARAERYTALPPGSYRFEVRARSNGNAWGPTTGFELEVRPPWWLTGWGLSLGVLLLLGLIVGGGRGWAHTLRRRNAELEVLVRARTAELTQAREQIAQAEKLSAMGQLMARLSHEINNPLTAIHNNLPPVREYFQALAGALRSCREWLGAHPGHAEQLERLWREQQLDYVLEDMPEALDSMRAATERIRSIQADLRAFLRGERPQLVVDDVDAVVRDTVELMRRTLPPGVRLEYRGGEGARARVHRGQLAQVMHNLLRNAVDAVSPEGQVQLTTAVRCGHVEVRVADSGPGVPVELRQRIFEPFFTTKDVGQGSGLGLAICRQIIEEHHGGTLWLDDAVERGACFVVRLPLAEA
jgi:signal transduction histidine kinase/streptogramin lyase